MPVPVDELESARGPFPVKAGSNEYEALSFLASNHEYGFKPGEIAELTSINPSSASKTMARLHQKELVDRENGSYFIPPEEVEYIRKRLRSLDAAVRLFESEPDEPDQGEELPSIDPSKSSTIASDRSADEVATALVENIQRKRE